MLTKRFKKLLATIVCMILFCMALPTIETKASSKYNASAALNYAAGHWNDGKGWCAEFVSDCIKAGGCSSYSSSASALFNQLKGTGMGNVYEIALGSDRSIYMPNYSGKISAGDPVFYYCPGCVNIDGKPYIHTVLCNGADSNGYMKAYSHHNANSGSTKYTYQSTCYDCNTRITKAYVYHFNTSSSPVGYIDNCSGDKGVINLTGWAYDPDNTSKSIDIHVYVGGPAGSSSAEGHVITANKYRPDVNNAYGSGNYHGFDATINVGKIGQQDIYIYGIDTNGDPNSYIGMRSAKITKDCEINFPQSSVTLKKGESKTINFTFDDDCIHSIYTITPTYPSNLSFSWGNVNWRERYSDASFTITANSEGSGDLTIYLKDSNYNVIYQKSIPVTVGHEHQYTTSKITKNPTCTETGVRTYTCSCGATKTETIAKTGHTYSAYWTVDRAATCQTEGSKSHHCLYCSAKTDITEISKTTHTGGTATCTKRPVCSVCGVEYGSFGGHNYSTNWTIDKAATCQTEGSKSHHCLFCSAKTNITPISKTAHTGGTATCTKRAVCSVCGTEYGELAAHVYSSTYTIDREATTTAEGEKSRHCLHCSARTDITSIPKIDSADTGNGNAGEDNNNTDTDTGNNTPEEDEDFSTVDDCENEIPAIGTEFEYKGIMYLITKSSETEGAVRVIGYFGNSKNVVIPNEVEYDYIDFKVTEIGNEAFANTPKLTKVTIGKNVTVIGINAFKECPQLKKIIINTKKLKKVGKGAFVDINKKAVIKVPRTKARAYKKILKKKGIAPNVRISS